MNVGAAFAGAPGNEFPNAYLASARRRAAGRPRRCRRRRHRLRRAARPKLSYAFSADLSQVGPARPAAAADRRRARPASTTSFCASRAASTRCSPPRSGRTAAEAGCGVCFEDEDVPAFAGASSDFSHVIFEANDSLVAGAPGWRCGKSLRSRRPVRCGWWGSCRTARSRPKARRPAVGSTRSTNAHASSTTRSRRTARASSSRPRRTAAAPDPQQAGETELYDRIDGSSTVEVSAPAPRCAAVAMRNRRQACATPQPAQVLGGIGGRLARLLHQQSSADEGILHGRGTDENRKQKPRQDPGNDLYRYDVDTGTLTDLTYDVDTSGTRTARASSASSAPRKTAPMSTSSPTAIWRQARSSGQPNLYVWHGRLKVRAA